MMSCVCCSGSSLIPATLAGKSFLFTAKLPIPIVTANSRSRTIRNSGICAFMVDSSSDFIKRMETAWLISQQPRPIECSSCDSKGHIECKWCGGTGFFILGDNMLCEVPSKNTSCIICSGKGSTCCSDCQGTGFRARWLEEPPAPKEQN
ncbi:protein PHOTOSYSTEM I ASSEMBLY 2, chloroplastic [Prosopis cineraria]|uniref:protein PHOTOSYSTEM I ASSEMBLY 2, chloroplastic n=1 Tax=Prosopis cineraria TaxID=364024 RepID=UPI00240EF25B|nr:protein PHOTOSYSTEM I ASSEMBLY 2, chloroplastic [Prosopis cineraria]